MIDLLQTTARSRGVHAEDSNTKFVTDPRQEFGADAPTVHVEKGWDGRWVELSRAEAEAVAAAIGVLLAV